MQHRRLQSTYKPRQYFVKHGALFHATRIDNRILYDFYRKVAATGTGTGTGTGSLSLSGVLTVKESDHDVFKVNRTYYAA